MTRAVRVWATLSDFERELIEGALSRGEAGGMLIAALHADLDEHHRLADALTAPSYDGFLIPEQHAGPRARPEIGECESCGKEVGTGLTAWITEQRTVLLLGPRCWKERSLRRARDTAGDQLEAFRIPIEETDHGR